MKGQILYDFRLEDSPEGGTRPGAREMLKEA